MRILIGGLIGALLSGVAVYLWQSAQVDDVTAELEAAQQSQRTAVDNAAEATAEINELSDRLEQLRRELDRAARGRGDSVIAPPVVELDDGRYFGFIKAVTLDLLPPGLVVDLAEFFTGKEADQARARDGSPAEELDYYIRNANPLLRQLEVEESVEITLSTWDRRNIPHAKKVDLATFERIFTRPKAWERNVVRNGYWITVSGGEVVKLQEQYVP